MEMPRKGSTADLGFNALVLTQFLTSFNDNAFRVAITLLAFHRYRDGNDVLIANVSTILFLLPYAMLSLLAGVLSDRYRKRSIFLFWKAAEIPMVLCGMYGLYHFSPDNNWAIALVLVMLTGLGLQVAFMSPARYGILPEYLKEQELAPGNGNLEFGSYLGILTGTMFAGVITHGVVAPEKWGWTLGILPVISALGFLTSLLIPRTPAANPTQPILIGLNPLTFVRNWRILREHKGLIPTVYGLTMFWGISTLYMLNAPRFGAVHLFDAVEPGYTHDPSENTPMIVAISIGVGLGSWIAGRLSRGTIELGLCPIGSFGWLIASIALAIVDTRWPVLFWLAVAGMSAGMFVVPLNAFLERYSPGSDRASCIATSNIVTVLGMIGACLVNIIFGTWLQLDPKLVFLFAAILLLVATWLVFRMLPDFFVRIGVMLIAKTFYRLRVVDQHYVPAEGPALLVFNHTSFMDGNIVSASFSRFVRFLVYRGHYNSRLLRWMGETMQSITVDGEGPPKEIIKSLRLASDALNRGELVCVFAEGMITRTGFLLPFFRGFEQILKRAPNVPIVPGYIDGMWGSIFSFHRGKFFWKVPRQLRYPVIIKFGPPMPTTSTSVEVREQVELLSVECAELRKSERKPLHRQFIRLARRYPRRDCIADLNTPMLSFGTALIRSVVLKRLLERKLTPSQYVGLLVPPSVGGSLANVALSFLGRVPVNLNYTIGIDVINKCIDLCEIKQVVTSRKFIEKVKLEPKAELIYLEDLKPDVRLADKLSGIAARILPARLTERWILDVAGHGMDDLATIVFSSGSTGTPKGVMLTQHNLTSNIESVVQLIDATEHDRVMGVLPFFHSFGYTITLWLPLTITASTAYHFNPLEPEVIGKMIREQRSTIFLSTATFLRGYLRKCEKEDFASLRLLVCGAEKLPMQVADQFEKKFGIRPLEGYGCTELSPVVSCNRPDYVQGHFRQTGNKNGTIGHPLPGVAVKVVDPDTGQKLPTGAEGLLLVKGPNVMKGYLHRPDLTAEAIRDGWYCTGDIAKLDDDGFITITDRVSRFSKIGGEMVPHGKVEEVIHEVLGTTDRLVAVVGIPDERKGERLVVLHTKLPIGVDELWDKLRAELPPLWLPAKASFFPIDEMPVLGSGKLDLKAIKSIANEKMARD